MSRFDDLHGGVRTMRAAVFRLLVRDSGPSVGITFARARSRSGAASMGRRLYPGLSRLVPKRSLSLRTTSLRITLPHTRYEANERGWRRMTEGQ